MTVYPPRADRFTIDGWTLVGAEFHAHFTCSRFGRFTEKVGFGLPADQLTPYLAGPGRGLADLLLLALGVSYYKVGAAKQIALPPLSAAPRAMADSLYTDGLAEFFVRAGLPFPADVTFSGGRSDAPSPAPQMPPPKMPMMDAAPTGPALVAFGGGKDSYVARAIIMAAGDEVELAAVVLSDAVRAAISATAPTPVRFMTRTLDPKLATATAQGFNGHVPITAINMLTLSINAGARGLPQVVFANERSADEPTMNIDGVVANHQFSKSSTFETLVRAAMAETAPGAPKLYSLLRPYSELWIGRAFASLKTPFARFTSCNRNFRLAGDATKRWCGACAKCAFTSLILAPFLSDEEIKTAFTTNFLDSETLLPLYRELCGLTAHKPWDCVGTIDECRAALFGAAQNPATAKTLAVRTLLPEILAQADEEAMKAAWHRALAPQDPGEVPPAYLAAADGLLAQGVAGQGLGS